MTAATLTAPFRAAADLVDPPAWEPEGRPDLEPHQVPPDGDWDFWLLEGGRGSGKTEACARYFAQYMNEHPGARGRIIAPTLGDAVESCIIGPSGLQAVDPTVKWLASHPGGSKVQWPNGSEALVLGTPYKRDVDRLRAAGNRELDWWEEVAANTQLKRAWDQAAFGLRLGTPHSIGSTTPRPVTPYRAVRAGVGGAVVALTHGTMDDNPHNSPAWVEGMKKRYEGTRLGRQELSGELIDDVEGALWNRKQLDAGRVDEGDVPDLARVVTAVDPAATSKPDADDTGIIVVGLGVNGEAYVLADRTCHLPPEAWGQRVVRTHHTHEGDKVIGETNNGGEMVEAMINNADSNVPFKAVTASRGKTTRAEPVAALFGAPPKRPPKVHLVGGFPELEDQLCTWVQGEEDSPDRLDAMVWGVTELMLEKQGSWKPL